ncbi:MAG: hypothetical protein K1X64_02305 [Myxococcaceae bacterium]|nr:hypothetical protein [Myxococcaceae bacterium]
MARAYLIFFILLNGCGSVCNRIVAADEAAVQKGKDCGAQSSHYNASTCNNNQNKCSTDDVHWLNTFADCIEKLPVCLDGQQAAWATQRFACSQSLLKVSATCLVAIQ